MRSEPVTESHGHAEETAFQSPEPDCGEVGGVGQASSFGGNGLLRTPVVALPRGCRRRPSGAGRYGKLSKGRYLNLYMVTHSSHWSPR